MRTMNGSPLAGKDILSADQFDHETIAKIFDLARRLGPIARREVRCRILEGYILGTFFFQVSTRTRLSTECAFIRLGASLITMQDPKFSSISKGESLADTWKVYARYCDVLAIRHPAVGAVASAAALIDKPVINCGDGDSEHPTQALLDLFTLHEACQSPDALKLALYGDLKHSRTVHSLCKLLCLFDNVTLTLISHPTQALPSSLLTQLRHAEIHVEIASRLEDGLLDADALYVVRPQREWHDAQSPSLPPQRVTRALLENHARPDLVILHPLPRTDELDTDVDAHPGAVYLDDQIDNGITIRMALALLILDKAYKLV